MTRTTLASGKVTLSVAPKRRMLLRKIHVLAGKKSKSITEQIWELCEHGLEAQNGRRERKTTVSLPGADLGRVLVVNRPDLYDDILADRF
jgi:hypothetical protein